MQSSFLFFITDLIPQRISGEEGAALLQLLKGGGKKPDFFREKEKKGKPSLGRCCIYLTSNMCVLGLLHTVKTYTIVLMSQWASLHSLKDARHGPEVSSTALLQLKGGQGTRPVILRGAGNDN